MFITFEGPEGAGKTTQASALARRLEALGRTVVLTREPGGTELGDRIRALLLPLDGPTMAPRAEALLFCGARAQLVEEIILPALQAGKDVVSDRYADSTLAYQGYGRGLPGDELAAVVNFSTQGVRPDLTILLDLPVEEGLKRQLSAARWLRFEYEQLAFHRRVRAGYLELARKEPQRWAVIDATRPQREVEDQVWAVVLRRFPGLVADG